MIYELNLKRKLFLEILKIVDTFESALQSIRKTSTNEPILQGIENIHKQLLKFLEDHNVKKIGSKGEKSDPFKHEVVKQLDSDKEENMILEEIQAGYSLQDNVLRPSKVIISNGKKREEKEININAGGKNE